MQYLLIAGGILLSILVGFVGLFLYAGLDLQDQRRGRLIALAALGIAALTLFTGYPFVAALLVMVMVGVLGGLLMWFLIRNRPP